METVGSSASTLRGQPEGTLSLSKVTSSTADWGGAGCVDLRGASPSPPPWREGGCPLFWSHSSQEERWSSWEESGAQRSLGWDEEDKEHLSVTSTDYELSEASSRGQQTGFYFKANKDGGGQKTQCPTPTWCQGDTQAPLSLSLGYLITKREEGRRQRKSNPVLSKNY